MDKDELEVASIAANKIILRDKMIDFLISEITSCPYDYAAYCPDGYEGDCIKCWRIYAENKVKEKS